MKLSKLLVILSFFISWHLYSMEITLYPENPVEGDPVLVKIAGRVQAPEGVVFGKKVRFRKFENGYYGIFGVDLEKEPGKYVLTLKWKDENGKLVERKVPFVVGKRIFEVQKLTLNKRYDRLSESDLARIRRENSQIRALWKLNTPILWNGPFIHPLGGKFKGEKGHRFGARRVINGTPRRPHSGADYPATEGTPVYAPNNGKVVLAGNHFFAGNSVYIDHGGGLVSMFFHLSRILVKQGEFVKKGQLIGLVGATGRVTGPHLHFGIYWQGSRLDPDKILSLPIPER